MKHATTYLVLSLALLLAACSGKDDDAAFVEYRYDFVTYMGYSGGVATWEYIGQGDSASVTLRATMAEPEKIEAGQRVLLSYTVPDTQGRITVKSINFANVASDSLRVSTKPVAEYAQHPIKLGAIWRTGGYINLRCEVEYTGKTRAFYLLADQATLECDTVHCYLVHDLMEADTTYFWRNCYGSFYVGKAFNRATCRTLRVHLVDKTYPEVAYYDFSK